MTVDPFELAKNNINQESTPDDNQLAPKLMGIADSNAIMEEVKLGADNRLIDEVTDSTRSVHFQLVVPEWDLDKLSRSFFSTFKALEDAAQKADQWVDYTEQLLTDLVDTLPEQWPQREGNQFTSKFLGNFFAITQLHPISQYLECFSSIPSIPDTFPVVKEVRVPQAYYDKTTGKWGKKAPAPEKKDAKETGFLGGGKNGVKIPWLNKWRKAKKEKKKEKKKNNEKILGERAKIKVRLRAIGIYWLTHEHALQIKGTTSEVGEFFFIFLKSIQRLFDVPPGGSTKDVKADLLSDVEQLAENLRSAHRGHLMYIYTGFEEELWRAFFPKGALTGIQSSSIERKLERLNVENQALIKKYSDALEHVLEDFYIRLQFFQIQKDALAILEEEMESMTKQYEQFYEHLKSSIDSIRQAIPESSDKWVGLNKFMFAFQMENAETKFHAEISKLKQNCSEILENKRNKDMVTLILDRCDKIAQMLPEHADIIHLDKLWSWTHKKIEIDEAVPLRYTVEQFFFTRLHGQLTETHARWMEKMESWTDLIDQQEQFFLFSFYSLRQEWTDPINGWQKADRVAVHTALKENSRPTIIQLENIFEELVEEFRAFEKDTWKTFQGTVDDLENVIFDSGLRHKLLRMASEGSGVVAAVLGMVLNLGQANVFKEWPVAQKLIQLVEKTEARWLQFKATLKPKPNPPLFSLPPYYSRVFMVDPLEISSLFVGRAEELILLSELCDPALNRGRCAIAVIGQAGYGKRSLIDYFVNNHLEVDTVRIHLALIDDNIVAVINNQAFSLDRMIRKIQLDRFHVVVLDGLENCFIEKVGGAQPLLDFFEWLQKTSREITWIISINELAWKTINQLEKTSGTFTHILQLDPMSLDEIKEILYHRHNVVGVNLQIKIPNNRYYRWLNKLRPEVCKNLLETRFFEELYRRCEGNPAVALTLWTSQCWLLDEKTILLDPIFGDENDMTLSDDELLVLRIILTQGRVGPQHLEPAVVSSKSLRVCLDNLKLLGLIDIRHHEEGTVFSVNSEAYLAIYSVLRKALLLP